MQDTEGSAKLALFKKFRNRIGSAIHTQYQLSKADSQELVDALKPLRQAASEGFMILPELTLLQIYSDAGQSYLSLIRNTGHLNNTSVLFEDFYIEEKETSVSVIPGFIGSRCNAFMRIPLAQLGGFSERILQMNTAAGESQPQAGNAMVFQSTQT